MISSKEMLYQKYQTILLNFRQCSLELNVTERHLYNLNSNKSLPFPVVRFGGCRVYIDDLVNFVESSRTGDKKRRGRPKKMAPPQYQKDQQLLKGEISDD